LRTIADNEGAVTSPNHRHLCRFAVWPAAVIRSIKDRNRFAGLPRISQATLAMCGEHDCLLPARSQKMRDAPKDSRMMVFQGAAHL
jgi:pimeloyl-ACP methyl ester carboxylesterase